MFYNPLVAEAPAVAAFLKNWGAAGSEGTSPDAYPESLARRLAVARADCSFADARQGHWPAPLAERTFASIRSRLYREA